MSDKIKKILETPEVPEALLPENIPALIKRKNIKHKSNKTVIKCISALAACAVIGLCATQFMPEKESLVSTENNNVSTDVDENNSLYFESISNYTQIYNALEENIHQKNDGGFLDSLFGGGYKNEIATDDVVMEEGETAANDMMQGAESATGSTSNEAYETLQQVEGIAEADIIKANSNSVYFVTDNKVMYIPFDNSNGTFGEVVEVNLHNQNYTSTYIQEMYLTTDKLVVINMFYAEEVNSYNGSFGTEVITYNISNGSPEYIGRYCQSGNYKDSRMKNDIIYLTTTQSGRVDKNTDEKDYKEYIPTYGASHDTMVTLPAEDIYIPKKWECESNGIYYTNISGIDVNNIDKELSIVSIAGGSNDIYCSGDNLYVPVSKWQDGGSFTEITRFSLENGIITPQASGMVKGTALNQFSMDEYNGYFRIATTSTKTDFYGEFTSASRTSNNVFILDMNMDLVGAVNGIAAGETIKSVNFKGDIGYVVTFQQTDPLFAIDLSDPANPQITDEFKITGYSSFLYSWTDDLLLGFGTDGDEDGTQTGIKLAMFDVSDNGDLKECGLFRLNRDEEVGYIGSDAVSERKALLLDKERNIIGFPIYKYNYNNRENEFLYYLVKYENGEFVEVGSISANGNNHNYSFQRGIYIGDYLLIFSNYEAISAELDTMNVIDKITLN